MSDIDLAITRSKRLERMLEKNLKASGRGLHEKVSSVESRLSEETVRKLRKVATIRNKIVHEENYTKMDDRKGFIRACDEAERELRSVGGRGAGKWKIMFLLLIALAGIVAYFFFKSM